MVTLKGSDIDAFAARPDPKRPIALVFGPDAGLVRERVDAIIKAAVDDPADPFALARLEGDALAVVAAASALALDGVVDAAFAGRAPGVETQFAKVRAAGTYPGVIIGAALRQVAQLHRARLAIDSGTPISDAIPGLNFRRKTQVEAALAAWTPARLERIMAQLAEASLEVRRRPALAETIAQRALMATATAARR